MTWVSLSEVLSVSRTSPSSLGTVFLVWECADQSHSRPDRRPSLWSLRGDRRCSRIPSGHCPIRLCSVLFCARVRVVTESAICSEPLQSPCTLYRMSVPVFRVVAVNVIHVSDLSRPSQSLTLAQTALQSLRSIADLSESHAMDLFNQCESPLDTCAVSGACVFEVVAVKVMCVSLLGQSTGHRGA